MMPLMGSLERILLGNPLGGSYTGGEKSMWEQGTIYTQNGDEGDSDYRVRSGYIPVRSNVYYTQRTLSGGYTLIQWYFYDSEYQYLGYFSDDTWKKLLLTPVNCAYIRIVILNPTDVPLHPSDVPNITIEDRSIWGWYISNNMYLISQAFPIEKRIVSAIYTGDLKKPYIGVYSQNGSVSESQLLPLENVAIADVYVLYRVFVKLSDNPNITPADMVNHGTWTVTFSDPVSEVWQSDGSVYYTPHNSEIQKGKILTITPPSSFKAVSLVVQDSTGQNSHDITGGAEVALSESTEWVYLTVGVAENPDVNLTNIDSFREQWSYSYKDIPEPAEPHWEGENFIFSASDIQVGKAWQKSGDDIILVDDAGTIALPIITNPRQKWRILITNASVGRDLNGVQIRKTGAGVTATACDISQGSFFSFILPAAGDQLAIHWKNGAGTTAQQLYDGITITGSEV